MKWQDHGDQCAARGCAAGAQLGGVTIQLLEAGARIGEPELESTGHTRRGEPGAIILHYHV